MTTTVQKWGNSLGIRIPKSVAETIGADEGKELRISTDKNKLIIEVVKNRPVDIEKLIKKITPKNSHGDTSWGKVRGQEVW